MKLYIIAPQIRELMLLADEREGELTDDEATLLDSLTEGFSHKVDVLCQFVREYDSEVAVKQAEIDRLKAELDRLEDGISVAKNNAKRRKDYLHRCMIESGQSKVKTDLFSVWIQANPPSATPLVEPEKLPEEFQRIKIEADCKAAVHAWKITGNIPEGFEIRQGEHLRIK